MYDWSRVESNNVTHLCCSKFKVNLHNIQLEVGPATVIRQGKSLLMPQMTPCVLFLVLILCTTMVTMISGAAICGTDFQPCRTDKDPNDTTISLEDCCEGYTCLSTQSFVPPFDNEYIWPGRCLTDRMLKIALLPTDLKSYMIISTYRRPETMTRDHKLPPQAAYLARLTMGQGDFPQTILKMEKKFGISIDIPDSIPEDFEFPEEE